MKIHTVRCHAVQVSKGRLKMRATGEMPVAIPGPSSCAAGSERRPIAACSSRDWMGGRIVSVNRSIAHRRRSAWVQWRMHGLGGAAIETQRIGVGCIARSVDRMPRPNGGRSQPITSATNMSKMPYSWYGIMFGFGWNMWVSNGIGSTVSSFRLRHSVSGWIAVLIGVMEHGIDDRVDIGVCNWAIHLGPFGC